VASVLPSRNLGGACRIGVISDTHNFLDPKIADIFKGVDHILHGGDIGLHSIILELEEIAPVTAVFGNTDYDTLFKEVEVIELAQRRVMLQHIFDPHQPDDKSRARLNKFAPQVVIFGHTHKPFCETKGDTLFFNPGYAGKKRFNLPRSVAILTIVESSLSPKFYEL
jgi:uncharacterized protein